MSDRLFGRIDELFKLVGWRVVTLKYGRLPGGRVRLARRGEHLREWIDQCPNSGALFGARLYRRGGKWREHLTRDLNRYPGIRAILDRA